jgi:transcriptional regulator with XRE-family HTH domain
MEFNEKLQELRKQKNLTQEELAERLFVSRTAVSKWELGKGYPNIDTLKAISEFFNVTVDELLSGKEILNLAEQDAKHKNYADTDDYHLNHLEHALHRTVSVGTFIFRNEIERTDKTQQESEYGYDEINLCHLSKGRENQRFVKESQRQQTVYHRSRHNVAQAAHHCIAEKDVVPIRFSLVNHFLDCRNNTPTAQQVQEPRKQKNQNYGNRPCQR